MCGARLARLWRTESLRTTFTVTLHEPTAYCDDATTRQRDKSFETHAERSRAVGGPALAGPRMRGANSPRVSQRRS
jgi:hypothetical protein